MTETASDATLTQVTPPPPVAPAAVEPTVGPPGRRHRRWWIALAVLLGVLVVVAVIAVVRDRGEDPTTRSADETATSVPTTVVPGAGGAPSEAPGGGGAPSGEPAPPPGEPVPEPGGEAPPEAAALAAPAISGIDSHCEAIAPVEAQPCTVTVRWVDNASDETGYRVDIEIPGFGTAAVDHPPDTTSWTHQFMVDETVCFTVIALRGDETASSGQECVTTSL